MLLTITVKFYVFQELKLEILEIFISPKVHTDILSRYVARLISANQKLTRFLFRDVYRILVNPTEYNFVAFASFRPHFSKVRHSAKML